MFPSRLCLFLINTIIMLQLNHLKATKSGGEVDFVSGSNFRPSVCSAH